MRDLDEVTGLIVDTSYHIHRELGPGLLESVYEAILGQRLAALGLAIERQKPIPIQFDGLSFDEGFRIDLLVDGRVVVELKSMEALAPVHSKQLLTYLRLMNLRVGLLINFGAPKLSDGLRRVVNNYSPTHLSPLRINGPA